MDQKRFYYSKSSLQLSISSPEEIRNLSKGAITNSHTINHRTKKPELGGLFCPSIFGTEKDYVCSCGRLKGFKERYKICSVCQSNPIQGYGRRSFLGHVELVAPVVHPWFVNKQMSYLNIFLGIGFSPSDSNRLKKKRKKFRGVSQKLGIKTNNDARQFITDLLRNDKHTHKVELIESILSSVDLCRSFIQSRKTIVEVSKHRGILGLGTISGNIKEEINKHDVLKSYVQNEKRPEWIIIKALPVLPPDLRPILIMKDNLLISSDLNTLYRIIINRNKRLSLLLKKYQNHEMILLEKNMVQQSVNQLFDNEKIKPPVVNRRKEPLVSLSKRLGGKKGRFRYNLLGKRVNYSARSVIIVNPKLKLGQCGLPLSIALTLYRPFVAYKLKELISGKKISLQKLDSTDFFITIISLINQLIKEHPILLNRAPTLHRMNIQAFEPILVNGYAIQLHPLVCSSFNADFDGDQMAVHLPLSLESQMEARSLMMSTKNILGPAHGNPIIAPSQEIVLGVYYATQITLSETKGSRHYESFSHVLDLYDRGMLNLTDKVVIIHSRKDQKYKTITSCGRILFYRLFPTESRIPFSQVNQPINKSKLSFLLKEVYECVPYLKFAIFINKLMSFGFHIAFRMGLSLGRKDLVYSSTKQGSLLYTKKESFLNELKSNVSQIPSSDLTQSNIALWSSCLSKLAQDLLACVDESKSGRDALPKPSIFLSLRSGAKGSPIQIRQLACMRGNMVRTTGDTVEQPILSNLNEGLNMLEYFYSAHGSRKGVIDTSLKTAVAGYFTRKLFTAAQSHFIVEEDCKTNNGIFISSILKDKNLDTNLSEYFFSRIYGRILSKDVVSPSSKKVVLLKDQVVQNEELKALKANQIEEVYVRSVLTCQSMGGSCQKCYGFSLHTSSYPPIGDPVGIIAAQSIGEPGTQLTMRTFHLGGALQSGNSQAFIRSNIEGRVLLTKRSIVEGGKNRPINLNTESTIFLLSDKGRIEYQYKIPTGASILIKDGQPIRKGMIMAFWDSYKKTIISQARGVIKVIENRKKQSSHDAKYVGYILHHATLKPKQRFEIYSTDMLNVIDGQSVSVGDSVLYRPNIQKDSKDITSDLTLVSQIFEVVKKSTDNEIVSGNQGRVLLNTNRRSVKYETNVQLIENDTDSMEHKRRIFTSPSNLDVQSFDYIRKSNKLVIGSVNPFNSLSLEGIHSFVSHFIPKIYFLYLGQGAKLNDRHVEVIFYQMLSKVITEYNPSDNAQSFHYLPGSVIDKKDYRRQVIKSCSMASKGDLSSPIVYGLSQVANRQESFLDSAAFQKTSKILSQAAILNKIESFETPMSNTAIGEVMPVGTGFEK